MLKLTAIVFAGLAASCSTSGPTPAKDPVKAGAEYADAGAIKNSAYTLKEGERIHLKAPLPDKAQIIVQRNAADGKPVAKDGFYGWDFDHDGRFDMLEVLNPSGKPISWAYDFDGDGVIDLVQKANEDQAPVKESH